MVPLTDMKSQLLRISRILSFNQAPKNNSLHHIRPVVGLHRRLNLQQCGNSMFSSRASLLLPQQEIQAPKDSSSAKRKTRVSAAKKSLRRVAVEAQMSRDGKELEQAATASHYNLPKVFVSMKGQDSRLSWVP